jgi:DNA-binding NarL/FixJ family response regulator
MSEITIVLIESHDLTRMALNVCLNAEARFKVIGETNNGTEGLKLLETLKPDIAVINTNLPDINGIELTRRFKDFQSETETSTKILIVTIDSTEDTVLAAFAAGADSYFVKETSIDKLPEVIEVTYNNNAWIDPKIANIVLTKMSYSVSATYQLLQSFPLEYRQVVNIYNFTEIEFKISELIIAGCNNKQISEKLNTDVNTVIMHIHNLLNKINND